VLEPQSTALFLVCMLAFAGFAWWMVVAKQVVFRVLAACLAFVPAMMFGVAAVNKYYDYYQTWGAAIADFTGQSGGQAPSIDSTDTMTSQKFSKILRGEINKTEAEQQGVVVPVTVPGPLSHITRSVLIFLPPQYFQASYADYRFPVIELYPGYPGYPEDWINMMGVNSNLDAIVSDGLAKPAVLVMPDIEGTRHRSLECLNLPGSFQDATYLARDVPDFVARTLRVQPPGRAWGEAGYSEGGFCAANLALQYPQDYGYAGVLSGYFIPGQVLAGQTYTWPFAGDRALKEANTPLDEVALIPSSTRIPLFWLGAGGSDAQDAAAAQAFRQVLLPRQPNVQLRLWPHGGHTGNTWRGLLDPMLEWMTNGLAKAAETSSQHGHGQRLPGLLVPCPTCLDGNGATRAPTAPGSADASG
jgi:enterochelin esterase-like enzyme